LAGTGHYTDAHGTPTDGNDMINLHDVTVFAGDARTRDAILAGNARRVFALR
jgi:predicted TIM-barrel fold metal-dependent hydrolase